MRYATFIGKWECRAEHEVKWNVKRVEVTP